MSDTEKHELLTRMSIQIDTLVKVVAELVAEQKALSARFEALDRQVLEHRMILAQGGDRFNHIDAKADAARTELAAHIKAVATLFEERRTLYETLYVRKESVQWVITGIKIAGALAGGGGLFALVKVFG